MLPEGQEGYFIENREDKSMETKVNGTRAGGLADGQRAKQRGRQWGRRGQTPSAPCPGLSGGPQWGQTETLRCGPPGPPSDLRHPSCCLCPPRRPAQAHSKRVLAARHALPRILPRLTASRHPGWSGGIVTSIHSFCELHGGRGEGGRRESIWRKSVPGRRNGRCRDPDPGRLTGSF